MAKIFVIDNTAVTPGVDAASDLGSASVRWGDVYVGSVKHVYLRNTDTYVWSSTSGYLTLVAATQIDLQSNIGVSAKNFIFDTITGVTFGTTTNSKLAFFGATPVVQQGGNIVTGLATLGLITGGTLPGVTPSITTTSTTYSILSSDQYIVGNSGTAFTVTLPFAIGSQKEFMVKSMGTATLTVTARTALDLIDSAATTTLAQWAFCKVVDFNSSGGITAAVKLCAPFDGVDAATTAVNVATTTHTLTAIGNAQIDTDQSVFGGASTLLDNTGDYWTVPSHADWNLGSNDFTIDAWIRIKATGNNMFVSQVKDSTSYFYFGLESNSLRLRDFDASSNVFDMSRAITVNTGSWYHFAAVRAGTVFSLYAQGSLLGTTSISAAAFTARTTSLEIGYMSDNASYGLDGWMDEFRFTNGYAWWTSSFTVPAIAYTTVQGRWLLIT